MRKTIKHGRKLKRKTVKRKTVKRHRNINRKLKRNTIKHKRINNKRMKRKLGGSHVFNMEENDVYEIEETYEGEAFFRKEYEKNGEKEQKERQEKEIIISKILMENQKDNPHPNIVHFFKVTDDFIDMEELETSATTVFDDPYEQYIPPKITQKLIDDMRSAKDYLQSLGIIYFDWHTGNVGKSKANVYKLFDFDNTGLIDLTTNEWVFKPYEKINNKLSPKEIDDRQFEKHINIL